MRYFNTVPVRGTNYQSPLAFEQAEKEDFPRFTKVKHIPYNLPSGRPRLFDGFVASYPNGVRREAPIDVKNSLEDSLKPVALRYRSATSRRVPSLAVVP